MHLNSLDAPNMCRMTAHFRRGSFFGAGSGVLSWEQQMSGV
jgi:hypothetical protein